ncbi:MAG: hypothetical protein A2138_23550 [Deltaproteobacteria bacterium RBG_16_71_12]|nr:MAG: hypothetical protein A2138_23550 [Deltaproteobacteria bacterium RBG_16_71_12]
MTVVARSPTIGEKGNRPSSARPISSMSTSMFSIWSQAASASSAAGRSSSAAPGSSRATCMRLSRTTLSGFFRSWTKRPVRRRRATSSARRCSSASRRYCCARNSTRTRASSSSWCTGLVMKSSAPASLPRTRAARSWSAVTNTTGRKVRRSSSRMARHVSTPPSCGIIRSSSTRSTSPCSTRARQALPFSALHVA